MGNLGLVLMGGVLGVLVILVVAAITVAIVKLITLTTYSNEIVEGIEYEVEKLKEKVKAEKKKTRTNRKKIEKVKKDLPTTFLIIKDWLVEPHKESIIEAIDWISVYGKYPIIKVFYRIKNTANMLECKNANIVFDKMNKTIDIVIQNMDDSEIVVDVVAYRPGDVSDLVNSELYMELIETEPEEDHVLFDGCNGDCGCGCGDNVKDGDKEDGV